MRAFEFVLPHIERDQIGIAREVRYGAILSLEGKGDVEGDERVEQTVEVGVGAWEVLTTESAEEE